MTGVSARRPAAGEVSQLPRSTIFVLAAIFPPTECLMAPALSLPCALWGGVQKNMGSNMRAYLAVILSAMTVATLLASPASARHFHHRYSYYGSYGYGSYVGRYGPYTPSLPARRYGPSLDFQGGSRY